MKVEELVATAAVFATLFAGCAAKVPATGSTPGRRGTPLETALAYNASLADANLALTNDVIAAQQAGLLSVATTTNLTSLQFTVADADRQLTAVLEAIAACVAKTPTSKTCVGNAAQLETLVNRIEANTAQLVESRDLGIKDAQTQAKVSAALTAIGELAGKILKTLQQGGLLQ